MKKIAIIIGVILVSSPIVAQKRSDFQGPKYKNFKYWKHKAESAVVVTTNAKDDLRGPKFKNYKPWQKASGDTFAMEVRLRSTRPKVTGPKYKNYKPWKNSNK